MKIETHPSLIRAHRVVGMMRKAFVPEMGVELEVRSWSNGREQGLCLTKTTGGIMKWKSAVIAECRSSDQIVVCAGNREYFDNQTNQPTDELWATTVPGGPGPEMSWRGDGRAHFDTEKEAAAWLVRFFRQ
jgi:hypothetical protein